MTLLTAAPIAACFCVAAFQITAAQSDSRPSPRGDIAFSVGIVQAAQLDATASPLPFAGRGFDVAARYGHSVGPFALTASIDGGTRSLSPDGSTRNAAETGDDGELRIGLQRALGAGASAPQTASLSVGIDVAATVAVTTHHYDDPTNNISDFYIGAVTIGPSATFRHAIGGGNAAIRLSVPAVGFVDHPYSDARTADPRLDARFATASVLRGVETSVSYAPAATARFGIEYTYRLHMLDYADVQPLRSVSQSLSVGVVRRFGAGR